MIFGPVHRSYIRPLVPSWNVPSPPVRPGSGLGLGRHPERLLRRGPFRWRAGCMRVTGGEMASSGSAAPGADRGPGPGPGPGSGSGRTSGENASQDSTFECNICLDTAKDAVISLCGHLFWWGVDRELQICWNIEQYKVLGVTQRVR